MHDTDQDIATLEQLLGPARAEYRALRHTGPDTLPATDPRLAPRRWRPVLVAASAMLAIGLGGAVLLGLASDNMPQGPRLIASPGALPTAPISRPTFTGAARPAVQSARPTLALSLPRRPAGTNG